VSRSAAAGDRAKLAKAGLAALFALLLGACGTGQQVAQKAPPPPPPVDPTASALYGPLDDNGVAVPPSDVSKIDPQYYRQVVATPADIVAPPGTVVVDPHNRFLYVLEDGGQAIRYGIGVGRDGFAWAGEAKIGDKQAWPKWFPPPEMVERDPKAAPYGDGKGMPGGLDNPLGARALYLYQGKKDTLFRLHGTSDPASIGKAVSSGCIRLLNQDIIDLYERVPLGASVVVLAGPETLPLDQAMTPAAQVDRL
jgi:lipoprotein-anchoring transpeptidase ErfK/SrfK